jgi:glycosyltransferase involved in cell wall biosynthesis
MNIKPNVLFYSNVASKKQFVLQEYYKTDIHILKSIGFNVKLSNNWYDFLCYWKYDISFIYFYRIGLIPAFISFSFNKKIYITGGIDDLNKETSSKLRFILQYILFYLCNIFTTKNIIVSTSDYSNILKYFPNINTNKISISSHIVKNVNPVDLVNVEKNKTIVTIAWMGRIENIIRKGVDKTIYTFSELLKLDPDYNLIIIGPLNKKNIYLEGIINKLKLQTKIRFTGGITEIEKNDILIKSLFYLQLSQYEGFGIAPLEALLFGNYVIHSNNGALKFNIGNNGIIINDINDYKDIASKIFTHYQSNMLNPNIIGSNYVKNNFTFNNRRDDFINIILK